MSRKLEGKDCFHHERQCRHRPRHGKAVRRRARLCLHLVYLAAFAPAEGESVGSISAPYPPALLGKELRSDSQGFLSITPKGIAEDFAQDLSDSEKQILTATQGPTAAAAFGANITTAAWKTKPSWFVIAENDRAIPPRA